MKYFITGYRYSLATMYRDISVSRYTDIKYLYYKLSGYFITVYPDINVGGYTDKNFLHTQLLRYFITGYQQSYISRHIDTRMLKEKIPKNG